MVIHIISIIVPEHTYMHQIEIGAIGTLSVESLILAHICLFQIPQAAFIK